jgi:two-component system OmpR family response regulator
MRMRDGSPLIGSGKSPPMSTSAHIAVLDDEVDITRLLGTYLQSHGYRVTQIHSGGALMQLMAEDPPAVVLLDLGLPGEDGLAIARDLRAHWHCGVVIVTGRNDAVDKVVGLEIGADDYVTKPFDLRELLARIKAVHRRIASVPEPSPPDRKAADNKGNGADAPETWHFAGWALDTRARRLLDPEGRDVPLTAGEFDLLRAFTGNAGRVMSRDALLELTRGRGAGPFDRTIDVQVGRLRKKLEQDVDDPQIIRSVRGAGYVFVPTVTLHQTGR